MIINKLESFIEKQNITAYQLAKTCGISHNTIYTAINNKKHNISLKVIDAICNKYNCRIEDLLAHEKI